MALIDQYTLSQDATFQHKVRVAMLSTASGVITQGTNSAQVAIARRVIDTPDTFAATLAGLVVLDTTVAASAPTGSGLTDAQIQSAVNTYLVELVR